MAPWWSCASWGAVAFWSGHSTRGSGCIISNISVRVGPGALDANEALSFVGSDSAGGTALFVGTVRSPNEGRAVEHLDYDVWPEKVEAELEAIAAESLELFGAERAYVAHRTGRVGVGEPSVVVAVSAAHRSEAFDACRWTIDTLKQRAPIWKREVTGDGDRWVANA